MATEVVKLVNAYRVRLAVHVLSVLETGREISQSYDNLLFFLPTEIPKRDRNKRIADELMKEKRTYVQLKLRHREVVKNETTYQVIDAHVLADAGYPADAEYPELTMRCRVRKFATKEIAEEVQDLRGQLSDAHFDRVVDRALRQSTAQRLTSSLMRRIRKSKSLNPVKNCGGSRVPHVCLSSLFCDVSQTRTEDGKASCFRRLLTDDTVSPKRGESSPKKDEASPKDDDSASDGDPEREGSHVSSGLQNAVVNFYALSTHSRVIDDYLTGSDQDLEALFQKDFRSSFPESIIHGKAPSLPEAVSMIDEAIDESVGLPEDTWVCCDIDDEEAGRLRTRTYLKASSDVAGSLKRSKERAKRIFFKLPAGTRCLFVDPNTYILPKETLVHVGPRKIAFENAEASCASLTEASFDECGRELDALRSSLRGPTGSEQLAGSSAGSGPKEARVKKKKRIMPLTNAASIDADGVAVCMLSKAVVHPPPNLDLWSQWLRRGKLFVHRKYTKDGDSRLWDDPGLHNVVLLPPKDLVETEWGKASLVEASLKLLMAVKECKSNFKFVCIVSDDAMPVKMFDDAINEFSHGECDAQLSYMREQLEEQHVQFVSEMVEWGRDNGHAKNWWCTNEHGGRPHSQWMILSMEAVRVLTERAQEIKRASNDYDTLVTGFNDYTLGELGNFSDDSFLHVDRHHLESAVSKKDLTEDDAKMLGLSLSQLRWYQFRHQTSVHNHFAPDEIIFGMFLSSSRSRIKDKVVMTEKLDRYNRAHAAVQSYRKLLEAGAQKTIFARKVRSLTSAERSLFKEFCLPNTSS